MLALIVRPLMLLALCVTLTGPAWAQSQQAGSRAFVDGIAAVVNKNVITLQQLATETAHAREQLRLQKIPVPAGDALEKQVLQRLIQQELLRQEAKRQGIAVGEQDMQLALETIAGRNRMTIAQLRHEVTASGLSWDRYLEELGHDVQLDMLRQRAVDNTIHVSDADVDAFLRQQAQNGATAPGARAPVTAPAPAHADVDAGPRVVHGMALAQILVAVPESADSSERAQLRAKAEALLRRVQNGEDFAGVAAEASDGPEALEGGRLGERPIEGWPDLFVEATRDLGVGGLSAIIRSGNGFHILKVLALAQGPASSGAGGAAPATAPQPAPTPPPSSFAQLPESTLVTQTHAHHILIKTSQVMSDEKAEEQLRMLRLRLAQGESFSDLAKRFSEDGSAPQGGDLGWLNPGDTVPPFERAMDALQPGEISEPVQTSFGWHLIRVDERREKDVGDQIKRMWARQILFQRRVEPALEEWLAHLAGEAYIDNRIDPGANRRRR